MLTERATICTAERKCEYPIGAGKSHEINKYLKTSAATKYVAADTINVFRNTFEIEISTTKIAETFYFYLYFSGCFPGQDFVRKNGILSSVA